MFTCQKRNNYLTILFLIHIIISCTVPTNRAGIVGYHFTKDKLEIDIQSPNSTESINSIFLVSGINSPDLKKLSGYSANIKHNLHNDKYVILEIIQLNYTNKKGILNYEFNINISEIPNKCYAILFASNDDTLYPLNCISINKSNE
jgi:hypothetical protein